MSSSHSTTTTRSARECSLACRANLDEFVKWPARAILLWAGCHRVPEPGMRQKYFKYPVAVKSIAKVATIRLDTRANGPAIAAFLIAGGSRPARFGSSNAWSVHHLYSGKFPYPQRQATTHAARSPDHFTQSAGLIAAHPIADALADEYPFFSWFLRAHAFVRFRYDPDSVFSCVQDPLGFAVGSS